MGIMTAQHCDRPCCYRDDGGEWPAFTLIRRWTRWISNRHVRTSVSWGVLPFGRSVRHRPPLSARSLIRHSIRSSTIPSTLPPPHLLMSTHLSSLPALVSTGSPSSMSAPIRLSTPVRLSAPVCLSAYLPTVRSCLLVCMSAYPLVYSLPFLCLSLHLVGRLPLASPHPPPSASFHPYSFAYKS